MESEALLTTVPEELKRLVRLIVRGFYSTDHVVVIDMLVRHPCVKEDDLADLLRYERKHLRSILNMLKTDKFLKSRMRVETDEEGRTTRHTFYFINYSAFVNVVKYKLDHMRRKIEMDERDNTSRSSFKCPNCEKTFTDYEVGQLLDPYTGELICTYCQSTVEEDESSIPKQDARTVLARFNEQIQPIYELLQVCEDVKLAPEVLDPEPTDMKKVMSRNNAATSNKAPTDGDRTVWSGDATRNVGFGFSENRVTITMDDEKAGNVEKKDQPVWMTRSTIDGVAPLESLETKILDSDKRSRTTGNDDILQTLLVHEPKAGPSRIPVHHSSDGDSDPDDSRDGKGDIEEMESEDDEENGPLLTIGSMHVNYNNVTSDMVAAMTPLEKEEYIRIGQQLYENIYD